MKKTGISAILALMVMLSSILSGCKIKGAGSANPKANGEALERNWLH